MVRNDRSETLSERLSLFVAKSPSRAILLGILVFNVVFFFVAAGIIALCAPTVAKDLGFWESVFYTVSMILDAGCIQYVVDGTNQSGALLTVICLIIVIVGMITFTGAVIGYVTAWISDFIRNANDGGRPLNVSGHTVILNWNSRASEIINDMLYSEHHEKVVVLVESGKEEVEREIADRLSDTLQREREALDQRRAELDAQELRRYQQLNHGMKDNVTVVVRQGTVYSSKQLRDISLSRARSVVLLSNDDTRNPCDAERFLTTRKRPQGDSDVVKALIQVANITADEDSWDDQKIVVEVNDEWTRMLVDRIIEHKERSGKCNIVPIAANQVLGRILSQLAIMPELNQVYNELFSNRGACFFSQRYDEAPANPDVIDFVHDYTRTHAHAVPLTFSETKEGLQCFFMAESEKAIDRTGYEQPELPAVQLNKSFSFARRNVLVIGGNSELDYIMDGFDGFYAEWGTAIDEDPLDLTLIWGGDETQSSKLKAKYPYVSSVYEAGIYDRVKIYDVIGEFLDANSKTASILLLSDDRVPQRDIDANVLVNLIYVKDMLRERARTKPDFNASDVDVVVEILDPRNYDVVSSYDVNNVVISNRYISKMLTQISERDAIFDFYADILSYDEGGKVFESKELYIKRAGKFFDEMPGACTADVLIRAVFEAGLTLSDEYVNQTVLLGYFRNGEMHLFAGDQANDWVELLPDDMLIVFSNH